jgi:hypothetical protein
MGTNVTRRTRAGRRPLTSMAIAGLATHVFFELGAGVGMPGASVLGPMPAAVVWAAGTRAAWRAARNRRASADTVLAIGNSVGLAAVIAHFAGWPRRRTAGLPWLRECEGLGPDLMPFYNPILYVSGAAAIAALVRENRSAPRALPLLAVGLAPALMAAQHAEHRRLRHLAHARPRWWNRRLRAGSELSATPR